MASVILRRVDASKYFYSNSDNSCVGCKGCGSNVAGLLLDNIDSPAVKLSMSAQTQTSILWNSWLKPLVVMVAGAVISDTVGLDEIGTFALVVAAFMLGLLSCHEIDESEASVEACD